MSQIPVLLGGLALFLYGMDQMGKGLKLLAGNKLEKILEKLTNNKIMGILVGALVTAIIQSSSATTVITVGFVNSEILTLSQAVNIILGANIGTTVTGFLLTLDIDLIAPLIAFAGMFMQIFIKKRKYRYTGVMLFGFGALFMGMNIMGSAVFPLSESQTFVNILTRAKNPIIGIIIGALFTALIQSSSATTGILITLANNGLMTFDSAFYLVLGQNIGTCINSVLASLGANKNAKRVAFTHVSFNLIGTFIFTVVSSVFPLIPLLSRLSPVIAEQIAFMHIIFNVSTTIILVPFTNHLVRLSKALVKSDEKVNMELRLIYINKKTLNQTIPAIAGIRQETIRMLECAKESLDLAVNNLIKHSEDRTADIEYHEEVIDYLHAEITKCTVKAMGYEMSKDQYKQLSYFLKISSNIERLGDYAYNISDLANQMDENLLKFSSNAYKEIADILAEVDSLFDEVILNLKEDEFCMQKIRTSAFKIEDSIEKNRENYVYRLKNETVSPESGLIYDKFYTNLARERDHLLNIANQYSTIYNQ
ncbi:MAG: Na/Pi cotransporter family protein [Tissierellia bacterium]|nr:Na/Pi cotransporter family protein [Tissierellia bacterium]